MIDPSPIQKAEAYLNVHLSRSGASASPLPSGPFLTLSRQSGTGGSALAETLRIKLSEGPDARPWTVYSRNLIDEVLRSNALPDTLARFLPEDHISEVDASIGELVGLHPNLWTLVQKTNEVIRRVAAGGNAILLGRGASFATQGIAGGVHVRLVASSDYRAKVMACRRRVSEPEARNRNAAIDAARRRYVKWTFNADVDEPTEYDAVLNVERLRDDCVAGFIAQLVHAVRAR